MVRPSPKRLVMYTSEPAESSLFSLVVVGIPIFKSDRDVGRPRPSDHQCLARKVTYYR